MRRISPRAHFPKEGMGGAPDGSTSSTFLGAVGVLRLVATLLAQDDNFVCAARLATMENANSTASAVPISCNKVAKIQRQFDRLMAMLRLAKLRKFRLAL